MEDLGDPFEEAQKDDEQKEEKPASPEQEKVEQIAMEKPKKETFKNADDAIESVSMRLAER